MPKQDIHMQIGGINHFHWILKLRSKKNQEDLYPLFRRNLPKCDGIHPLVMEMHKIFGLFPFPAPNHLSEFLTFGYELSGPLWLHHRRIPKWDTHDPLISEIQEVVDGNRKMPDEWTLPSQEVAVPIMMDMLMNRNNYRISVNVQNKGMAISNLPEDTIVEISANVDEQGIHPIPIAGGLPEPIAAICRQQCSIQKLLVQAYQEQSKDILLQALLIDPLVNSIPRARRLIEEMFENQAEYLPPMH